ncbi:MAG: Uncharacterized protein FD138_1301 [Planctomycetota bacterium]|nr:MAG: Uncharacterized protein FD138_1301 [Planctomycetota bacterium]
MSERPFRRPESYEAEKVARKMLPGFLQGRGFRIESNKPEHHGQTIVAKSPEGERLTMRVRLCWRREIGKRDSERVRSYSASQLLANIKGDDWIGSLQAKVEREKSHGVTHLLFIQRDDNEITFAALVPLSELVEIWKDQRDISERLIHEHKLGRRKKNHAMNGTSPTLWLQDDRGGEEVANALWNHRGVRDLAKLEPTMWVRLPAEEANPDVSSNESHYSPQDGDRRQMVERQIRERRGQQQFRDALRKRYADRCLVTGCEILAVLEAAHISPYRGEDDNHTDNGLLLRTDIHTLFDLDLLGIEPDQLRVELHPGLIKEYGNLAGKTLGCARSQRPSKEALKRRYELFQQRMDRPE